MSVVNLDNLDANAIGLKLFKHGRGDKLVACELVVFREGASAINTVLRRAAISGVVKVEPFTEPMDFFADVFVDESTFVQSILLDRDSYSALKNHWMRCKIERDS